MVTVKDAARTYGLYKNNKEVPELETPKALLHHAHYEQPLNDWHKQYFACFEINSHLYDICNGVYQFKGKGEEESFINFINDLIERIEKG